MTGLRIAERPPLAPSVWQADAACRGMDLDTLYPETSYAQARAICSSCLVLDACRRMADAAEAGLPAGAIFGMFAGETPLERIRRRRGESPGTP